MQIKPSGPGGPLPPASDNGQSVTKFSQAARLQEPGAGTVQPFQSITSGFHKADLQDPAKVDQMISGCTGELLQSALERTGAKASPADTANLSSFMQNDPVIHGKLLNYLQRVLT
jgi:hypothetical protein